jgi:hypothetical protein
MLEVIQFLFSSFWYWLGGLFYLGLILSIFSVGMESLAHIIRGYPSKCKCKCTEEKKEKSNG